MRPSVSCELFAWSLLPTDRQIAASPACFLLSHWVLPSLSYGSFQVAQDPCLSVSCLRGRIPSRSGFMLLQALTSLTLMTICWRSGCDFTMFWSPGKLIGTWVFWHRVQYLSFMFCSFAHLIRLYSNVADICLSSDISCRDVWKPTYFNAALF